MPLPLIKKPVQLKGLLGKSKNQMTTNEVKLGQNGEKGKGSVESETTDSIKGKSSSTKKPLIKLKQDYIVNPRVANKVKYFSNDYTLKQKKSSLSISEKEGTIEKKKNETNEKEMNDQNKNVQKYEFDEYDATDETIEKTDASEIIVLRKTKSKRSFGNGFMNVKSKGSQSNKGPALARTKSRIRYQEKPQYIKNTNGPSDVKRKESLNNKIRNQDNALKFNQLNRINKRELKTTTVNSDVDLVNVIKERKKELIQKSKDMNQKKKQDLEQLLKTNQKRIRRINTKEIMDYESPFNTDAPMLFCEDAYKISTLSPIENKLNMLRSILENQKNEIMPAVKSCIENCKEFSNTLKIIVDALTEGDDCVLSKLNKNELLKDELLADLDNVIKEIAHLQT